MTDAVPAPPASPPSVAKRRGCFGLAFKGVLGCAALAFGSFVALILCLPMLCGGLVRSGAEQVFDGLFRGSLTVSHVDLAWSSEQRIRDAVLKDPEGREVARVSAVLPSILDLFRSKKKLRARLELDADFAADEQGISNLQRALERREPGLESSKKKEADEPSSDPVARLANLDVEIEVASKRLSWSDAETRRAGKPFEVRDLEATLRASPGQPLTVSATGKVVSDSPGALDIQATVHGPIETGKAWPLGAVDAKVRVEGFSTAMVDGVAGLRGKLTEVLGPRFDLKVTLAGATPQQGDLEVELASQRTSFGFAGRFEGGFLRARDGAPVRLSLGVPRGFVSELLAPALPPGVKIAWEESDKPWTVTVANLALPIPDAEATDIKGIAKRFERLACDVDVDLPSRILLENEQTRSAGVHAGIEAIRARLRVEPGQPLDARLEASVDTAEKGGLVVEVKLADLWKALAEGRTPHADVDVRLDAVSTGAIDALASQGGRLIEAIGPRIAVTLAARDASPESGWVQASLEAQRLKASVRGRFEGGMLRCDGDEDVKLTLDPARGWIDRQISPLLPQGLQVSVAPGPIEIQVRDIALPIALPATGQPAGRLACRLPGLSASNEATRAAKLTLAASDLQIRATATADGAFSASVQAVLDTGEKGKLSLEATTSDLRRLLEFDILREQPPTDAKVSVEGVSTAGLDALAGLQGDLVGALGPRLAVSLDARGVFSNTTTALQLDISSPTTNLTFTGRIDKSILRCAGDQGLSVKARLPGALVSRGLGPFLPQGAQITVPGGSADVELSVREIEANLFQSPWSLVSMLESLGSKVDLKLSGLGYADESTRVAKVDLSLRDVELAVEVAPKKPLAARLSAVVGTGATGEEGRLEANASLADPWFMLRGEGAKVPPVDGTVHLKRLPTAALDALCGRPGLLSGLFGEKADLEAAAQGASRDAGSFSARLASDSAAADLDGRLEKGSIVSTDKPLLAVTAQVTQPWLDQQVGPLLPAGSSLAVPDGKGSLQLTLRDVRLPLPTGPVTADALSAASFHLDFTAPSLAYSDAKTAAAKSPAVVRDLRIRADLAPGQLPAANLSAKIEGEPAGEITAVVRALDPFKTLADEKGLDHFHIAADVNAKALPTGLLDALAAQGGLLVDVLGPRLDLTLHSDSISFADGTFTADLHSDQASVHCDRGGMKDGVLYLEKVQGKNEALLARTGLTPLFTERVVGSLVPTLVNVEKPKGSDPVSISVEELRLPLDADLSKLDALVRVSLGDVTYRLLPGLDGLLGKSGATSVRLPEIRVPIKKGIASYDSLPIRIGGHDCQLKGTFSLVDKSFKMETQLPLAALGKGVSDSLDGLRGILDPSTMVPLELRGSWKSPKLRIGDDFLKKVAQDALKKQGGNLLEELLKKKKN